MNLLGEGFFTAASFIHTSWLTGFVIITEYLKSGQDILADGEVTHLFYRTGCQEAATAPE